MVHIDYSMTPLEDILEIHRIVTIHYYEYKKNFSFGGEAHDFWEFICVDRGDVNITAGENKLTLHKDEIAFHEHIAAFCSKSDRGFFRMPFPCYGFFPEESPDN